MVLMLELLLSVHALRAALDRATQHQHQYPA